MQPAPTASGDRAAEEQLAQVWAWDPQARDFAPIRARRVDVDQYEVVGRRAGQRPVASPLEAGDVVRCELSDGELVVREHVFRATLV